MTESFIVRVCITSRPDGEAPKWVRDCWIGVEFNAIGSNSETLDPVGVMTKDPAASSGLLFRVPQDQALKALSKVSITAHKWWIKAGFPRKNELFVFNPSECREIALRSGVPIRVWDLEDPCGAHDNPEWTRDVWDELNP